MRGLFFRIYAAVALALVILGLSVYFYGRWTLMPSSNVTLADQIGPHLRGIAGELAKTAPESGTRRTLLRQLQSETGPALAVLPMAVLPLDPANLRRLRAGEVVVVGNELSRCAYIQIGSEPTVLEWELFGLWNGVTQWLAGPLQDQSAGERVPVAQLGLNALQWARLQQHPIALSTGIAPLDSAVVRLESGGKYARMLGRPAPGKNFFWLLPAAVLLMIAGAIGAVLVPMHRQMVALAGVTAELAGGNLEVRSGKDVAGPIGQLAGDIDELADRMTGLLQQKEGLILAIAHELRTPIARMYFSLDLAKEEPDPTERQRLCAGLQASLGQLRDLVEQLVSLGRLGGAAPAPELADRPLGELVLAAMDSVADCRAVWRGTDPGVRVRAAPVWLTRAVANVLSNANRYAKSTVEVELTVRGEWARVIVDDDGPGVPPDDRGRVFEPFARLDECRCREDGGMGIGLAMVERIMATHGGKAWVEEAPLGGARFVLELPVANPSHASTT